MSLMDAPAFDASRERRTEYLLIGSGALITLVLVLTLVGYVLGHGWLFTNLHAEHQVSTFLKDVEAKDFAGAYAIYTGGTPNPGYPIDRFTEDWTTASPVKGSITEYRIHKSVTDGTGAFGTGIIVRVEVNGSHELFFYYDKKDHSLTWPAPHVFADHR